MVVVVVVVVVEVVVVGGAAEVVVVTVVVVAETVAVVVVVLPGVSEVPCGAESEDDAEGATSAEPEVADGATLGTGSTFSVPGAAVDVVAVTGGTEEATSVVVTALAAAAVVDPGPLSSPPNEQAEPTSPKTAAKAAVKTNFACLTTKKSIISDSGFISMYLGCFGDFTVSDLSVRLPSRLLYRSYINSATNDRICSMDTS